MSKSSFLLQLPTYRRFTFHHYTRLCQSAPNEKGKCPKTFPLLSNCFPATGSHQRHRPVQPPSTCIAASSSYHPPPACTTTVSSYQRRWPASLPSVHITASARTNAAGPYQRRHYFLPEVSLLSSQMQNIMTAVTIKIPSHPSAAYGRTSKNALKFIRTPLSIFQTNKVRQLSLRSLQASNQARRD